MPTTAPVVSPVHIPRARLLVSMDAISHASAGRFSMNDLPTELLEQIVESIDLSRFDRILGHISDDPPPTQPDPYLIRDFLAGCIPLRNLCLTSRRFRHVTQKHLFTAPVLGGFAFHYPNDTSHARIAFFLRTLITRPDLRRYVQQLRLCYPPTGVPTDQREEYEEANMGADPLVFILEVVRPARIFIDNLDLPADVRTSWRKSMIMEQRYTLLQFIMVLLPHVKRLVISENSSESWLHTYDHVLDMSALYPRSAPPVTLNSIRHLPCAQSLRSMKLCSLTPIRLDGVSIFPNLDTLDLSFKLAGLANHDIENLSVLYDPQEASTGFEGIRHLRLDCQTKSVGIWDFSARHGMTYLLGAFSRLDSLCFYAEPSSEKNPFRSVRAFPHYQANIQAYPDAALASDYDASTGDSYWDERLYAARTEWVDYQYLVDSLFRLRPFLKTLTLPGGFWTLPGATRKPLPRFELFPQLRHVVLPQAAILSIKLYNMRFPGAVQGDFDLSPVDVLPEGLEHLEIFDADMDLLQSKWLQTLLAEKTGGKHWSYLTMTDILFGPAVTDAQLGDLQARKIGTKFWAQADQASFQIRLGRDKIVPVCCHME
ncbi:hypothetical protein ACEQ8H_003352 [Pleosporales sp. CAS-2024a]